MKWCLHNRIKSYLNIILGWTSLVLGEKNEMTRWRMSVEGVKRDIQSTLLAFRFCLMHALYNFPSFSFLSPIPTIRNKSFTIFYSSSSSFTTSSSFFFFMLYQVSIKWRTIYANRLAHLHWSQSISVPLPTSFDRKNDCQS